MHGTHMHQARKVGAEAVAEAEAMAQAGTDLRRRTMITRRELALDLGQLRSYTQRQE